MLKETDYGALPELLLIVKANEPLNREPLRARIEAKDRRKGDAVTPAVVASLIIFNSLLERPGSPAGPWSPPLTDGIDRLGVKGKCKPESSSGLASWGVWVGNSK